MPRHRRRATQNNRLEPEVAAAETVAGDTGRSFLDRISWAVVGATTLLIPLLISLSSKDRFRLPKDLVLTGSAIILLALLIAELILHGKVERSSWPRTLILLVGGVVVWCSLNLMSSTNWRLSVESLLNLACAAIFLLAVCKTAPHRFSVLWLLFIPAVINAVLAVAQRTGLWNPIRFDPTASGRLTTVALLGNPNDIGMFLLAPCLAAAALAVTSRRHAPFAVPVAVIAATGIAVTETVGAIAAVAVGLLLIGVRFRPRLTVAFFVAVLALSIIVIRTSPERWARTQSKMEFAARGDLDPFLSGRLTAFVAAWRMFVANPVTGVGLGSFPYQYFEEKIALERDLPWLLNRNTANFGEVHNEHLQILAEAGLPAYLLFLAAIAYLARRSFTMPPDGAAATALFARNVALPLAAAFFVLAMSSFPLRLAAPTVSLLFLSGLALKWSERP